MGALTVDTGASQAERQIARCAQTALKQGQSGLIKAQSMDTWQMQDAKARLSELVKREDTDGPQQITLHGCAVAVVLSREEYDRLTGAGESLVDFMRRSPLYGLDDLEFPREQSLTRDILL